MNIEYMTNISEVFDPHGNKVVLGNKIASGGEGSIYPILNKPEVLIKIYHPEILTKRGDDLNKKIAAMVEIKDQFKGKLCWPSVRAFNSKKQWVGYAMRRAKGISLFKMAHPMIYKDHFSNLDRVQVVNYLISFIDKISMLHSNNVMMGDYNLHNILCNPGGTEVELIDCDSYQLRVGTSLFRNPVGSPDLTAPEQQGKDFSQIVRTVESELFSVAVVLFKCLMLGRHPYDSVGGDDPIQNIKNGHFPYGKGSQGIPRGPWYNIWSHMPHRIKSNFIQTFTDGASTPDKRLSLQVWRSSLTLYRDEMKKGWHEISIRPEKPKEKSYRGKDSF